MVYSVLSIPTVTQSYIYMYTFFFSHYPPSRPITSDCIYFPVLYSRISLLRIFLFLTQSPCLLPFKSFLSERFLFIKRCSLVRGFQGPQHKVRRRKKERSERKEGWIKGHILRASLLLRTGLFAATWDPKTSSVTSLGWRMWEIWSNWWHRSRRNSHDGYFIFHGVQPFMVELFASDWKILGSESCPSRQIK